MVTMNNERKVIDLEQGWNFIQKGIAKLKNLLEDVPEEEFSSERYMLLHTDRYRESFKEYIKNVVRDDTEEAHTFMKVGLFLMREDKLYYDNQEEPNRKRQISAEEAFHEAIKLYKKLDRKQEVAYAQYQLGCVLRDRTLFESVKSDVTRLEDKLFKVWPRALEYYGAVGDTDMFLRVCMEHSDLYLAMRLKPQMNKEEFWMPGNLDSHCKSTLRF